MNKRSRRAPPRREGNAKGLLPTTLIGRAVVDGTPRAAAGRKGASREARRLLLAEFEHAEAGQPADRRYDVAELRRELGVE